MPVLIVPVFSESGGSIGLKGSGAGSSGCGI